MLNLFRSRLRQLFTWKKTTSRRRRSFNALPSEALEQRLCLTNLNFLAGGQVNFGGGAADNNLTISVVGDTYTISDPNEIITIAGANAPGTSSGSGTNTVTFDATTVTDAITRFNINGNAGTDSVTINSMRPGAEGVSSNIETITIAGDLGSNANPSANSVIISATTINLNAEIHNSVGVILTGSVSVNGNSEIDTGTGPLDINGSIDGGNELRLSGGTTTLDGAVGSGTPLSLLEAEGQTSVRVQSVAVDGNITLRGNQVLTQGTITGDNSGNLTLEQFTNGNNLSIKFGAGSSFNSDGVTGFASVNIGNVNTGLLSILNDGDGAVQGTGSFRPGADIILTADSIGISESIDQGANTLTINVDSTLNWSGQGAALGTGAVTINKINAGGTLSIPGVMGFGRQQWGANAVTVNAVGSTVDFSGGIASNIASFTATAAALRFDNVAHGGALAVQGDVNLTASTITLGGGIFSTSGNVVVNGATTTSGSTTFRIGAGGSLSMNGSLTSSSNDRLLVRGVGGALDSVTFSGDVTGFGAFTIDGTAAQNVSLGNVSATSIIVRAVSLSLGGNLNIVDHMLNLNEGNLQLFGNITLTSDSQLNYTADTSGRNVLIGGSITGAGHNLSINAGIGGVVTAGAISGVGNLSVATSGQQFITHPITVTGTFDWNTNGGALTIYQDVTAGTSITIDVVARLLNGATLNAPVVNNGP